MKKNKYVIPALIMIFALLILTSCKSVVQWVEENEKITNATSSDVTVASSDVTTVKPAERIALYWENTTSPKPERKPWSDALISALDKNFATLDKATDTKRFCPKYSSLNKEKKLKALGEFFVALAYFESGYNPESSSVDVGKKDDLNSYSVGLYQMSGNDSAAKLFKADYKALKNPITNINVAVEQMRKQIVNTGLFILPNTSKYRYWAIILDGNKYNQIPKVIERVNKYAPECK